MANSRRRSGRYAYPGERPADRCRRGWCAAKRDRVLPVSALQGKEWSRGLGQWRIGLQWTVSRRAACISESDEPTVSAQVLASPILRT